MENSRIAGAKRRLIVAKRLAAGVAAVAFGVTFVAIRSGGVATSNTAVNQTQTTTETQEQTTTQSQQNFFGNSSVGSSSGAAPSASSSSS